MASGRPSLSLVVCALVLSCATLVAWSEAGAFAWAVFVCPWPNISPRNMRLLVISDTHVLGRGRTALDVWWTTRLLAKSAAWMGWAYHPDAVLILGDHLDEGRTATSAEWHSDVEAFRTATKALRNSGTTILDGQSGNHDVGLGASFDARRVSWFERDFGDVNRARRIPGFRVEFVTVNSVALVSDVDAPGAAETRAFLDQYAATRRLDADAEEKPTVVLLTHIPLYRENDMDCAAPRPRERGHVTYVGANVALVPNVDVLSQSVSDFIVERVRPDVALAGHLHSQCVRERGLSVDRTSEQLQSATPPRPLLEVTVPAASHRMRPDPGFVLLSLQPPQPPLVSVCHLPDEHRIFASLVGALFVAVAALLAVCARRFGSLRFYSKVD